MKLLITGSRTWPTTKALEIYDILDRFYQKNANDHVIIAQGGCPTGVDQIARNWAHMNYVPCLTWPAHWPRHGNRAGPIRNRWMIDFFEPEYAYAFFWKSETPGTRDCIKKLSDALVPVKTFYGGLKDD